MKKTFLRHPQASLYQTLNKLLIIAKNQDHVSLKEIFNVLSGRGYAMLITLFSFPFCLPITIPGLSTPFGFVLAFLGLRFALAKRLWWPKWILIKTISGASLTQIVEKSENIVTITEKFIQPRLLLLTEHRIAKMIHGFTIFLFSILLLLPLPIPFTNMLVAIPIFCIGLGLLEKDGIFIIIGYILAIISIIAVFFIVLGIKHLF